MRKIDRLFEIVQILRGNRLRTAEFIAHKLGVSVRTTYRDIQGLMASGVPIEGERGVGYILRQQIELPPLHFTPIELKAIKLGMDLVKAISDAEISNAAQEVEIKIDAVSPQNSQLKTHSPAARVYFSNNEETKDLLLKIRHAVDNKLKVFLKYKNELDKKSNRTVRPLGLEYWGKVWTLTTWCELRQDFRVFRIDRIQSLHITEEPFSIEPGKSYQDYLKTFYK